MLSLITKSYDPIGRHVYGSMITIIKVSILYSLKSVSTSEVIGSGR